ncbi:hypothetical protein CRG98_041997 [Punica granatum]|uniref:BED-type domain-containing protein n=1 Tax=Punica granatum TaxID=22663 RepID=A0A2I0I154_PUNGR|nr:hypothetical protein CRG98_041997 [Punica granatum]
MFISWIWCCARLMILSRWIPISKVQMKTVSCRSELLLWDTRFDGFIERTRVVTSYQCKLCMGWVTNKSKDCMPAHLGRVGGIPLPPRMSPRPCSKANLLPLPIAKACWMYFGYPLPPSMFDRFAVGVVPIAAGVPAGSSVPPGQGDAMEVEGLVGVWDPRFDDFIEKTRVVTSYQCTLCKGWITNKSKDCIPAHLGRVVGLPLPPRVSYKPCSEAKQLPLPIAQACWAYFSYPLHPSMFDEFAAADVPSAAGVPSAGASIPPEQEEDLNASMVLDDLLASLELEHLVGTPWNEEHVSPHWHFAQPPVLPSSHHTALFPALSQPQPQPQFSPLSGHVGSWDSQVGGTLQGGGSSAPGHAGGWVSQLGV